MKKIIFAIASFAAIVALAVSCEKGEQPSEPVDAAATVQTLTVQASLKPGSGEGMKTTFAADDILRIRFADGSGKQVGRTQVLPKASGEGASATFSADGIAVPNGASTIYAYLDNKSVSAVNYGSAPTQAKFASQNGTLAGAQANQVIMGTSSLSGNNASVSLEYKTTIIKTVVNYPEGVTPVAGETTVTLSCGQINKAGIDLGLSSESTRGDITVPAAIDGDKAVSYIAVWADGLGEGSVFSNIQSTKYGCDFDADGIGAGTTCTAELNVETLVYNLIIPDEEYKITGVRGNLKSTSVDWITLSNGTITVAENKTGAVRTGNITLDNDKQYNITQIGPNELSGSWTLITKLFDPNKTLGKGNTNAFKAPVTIALAAGENGNNVLISGLYLDAKVEGKVEINYETMAIRLGVYVSSTKIYDAGNGKYCVLLPECASTTAYWSGYNFCPKADKAFSDTNYDWLWFDLNEDYSVAKYQYYGAGQISPNGSYRYCGLSFVKASATAVTGTSYDVIYQANYNGSNAESMYFKK